MWQSVDASSHRYKHGFTLVGMLVSLALLATLLAFVAGVLRQTEHAWPRISQLEAAGTTESVRNFLQRQMSEAMQRYYIEPNGARLLTFGGEPHGMTFVAPALTGSGQYGLSAFSLDLIPAPRARNVQALALSQVTYRPDIARDAAEAAPRRVLLDNIENMTISYYGSLEQGDKPDWHDEWNSSKYLPQLVSIELNFPPDDPRSWQTLAIELKLALQPG